jgi:hypothetical protein
MSERPRWSDSGLSSRCLAGLVRLLRQVGRR